MVKKLEYLKLSDYYNKIIQNTDLDKSNELDGYLKLNEERLDFINQIIEKVKPEKYSDTSFKYSYSNLSGLKEESLKEEIERTNFSEENLYNITKTGQTARGIKNIIFGFVILFFSSFMMDESREVSSTINDKSDSQKVIIQKKEQNYNTDNYNTDNGNTIRDGDY